MSLFLYLHPDNPQERLLKQAVDIIKKGGIIIYPTDSGYALGCAIGNKEGMDRILKIRNLPEKHNFTLMCKDLSNIAQYAIVSNEYYRILKAYTPGKYTFILPATKKLPRRLMTSHRKTIGIRIPDNKIAMALLNFLEDPLLSCSLILTDDELVTLSDPEEIKDLIENKVDVILNGGYLNQISTSVIDLSDDTEIKVIRTGAGDTTHFE